MRKFVIIGCVLWIAYSGAISGVAQVGTALEDLSEYVTIDTAAAPSPLASAFRLNYTIPDAPAFDVLEVDPSNILHPASAREFVASLTDFTNGEDGFSIPGSFAVEFSPGLLIGGKHLTLAGYRENPLNWLRLSAATKRVAGAAGPTEIAFGLRFSVKDEADPRRNDALLVGLDSLGQLLVEALASLPPTSLPANTALPPDSLYKVLPDSVKPQVQQLVAAQVALLAEHAQRNSSGSWNNSALDLAAAVRFSAADSTGKDLRATDLRAWLTLGTKIDTWGQVLFGLNGGLTRDSLAMAGDDVFRGAGSAGLRFYAGTNQYKMFLETQFETDHTGADRVETLLLNGGGEAHLRNGTWIEFGGGVERDFLTDEWNVVSKFSLKLGLPFLSTPP